MSDKRCGSGCGVRRELDILHAFNFGGIVYWSRLNQSMTMTYHIVKFLEKWVDVSNRSPFQKQ